jgi:hypothetical protein
MGPFSFAEVLPFLRGSTKQQCTEAAAPGVDGCSQHTFWDIPQKALSFLYLVASFVYRFTRLSCVAAHSWAHSWSRTTALRAGLGPEGLLLVEIATNAALLLVLYNVTSWVSQRVSPPAFVWCYYGKPLLLLLLLPAGTLTWNVGT